MAGQPSTRCWWLPPPAAHFESTRQAAKLDLFFLSHGRRFGVEFKLQEAPRLTPSMRIAKDDLRLEHLWVIYPGSERYPLADGVTVWPLRDVSALSGDLSRRAQPDLAE